MTGLYSRDPVELSMYRWMAAQDDDDLVVFRAETLAEEYPDLDEDELVELARRRIAEEASEAGADGGW